MKKLLVVLLLVAVWSVSAFALPYINVRISEMSLIQTAPSVAFTAGIEAPLGIPYTSLDTNLTYRVDNFLGYIITTWEFGFAVQYGSNATHIRLGVDGHSLGLWSPYLEFKISLSLAPFKEVQYVEIRGT